VENVEPALMLTVAEEPQLLEKMPGPLQASGGRRAVILKEEKVIPELHLTGGGFNTSNVWYLDNGASNHMTGDPAKFKELNRNITGKVRFGVGSAVEIMGKGSVLFQCKDKGQWLLHEVYYIPKLKSNLVSLGQLTEVGHRILLDNDFLEVVDKVSGKLVMRIDRSVNRLYKIELKLADPVCLMGRIEEPAWLWHARLGHVNFKSLRLLVEKKMAAGVPMIEHPEQVCHGCLAGKQARKFFPKTTSFRAEKPLQLVYVDLCGPITPPTPAGNKYFMLLVDDHSRWMNVSMLKSKDQAVDVFVKYKAEVQNQTGEKIKVLRSDRGGEFLSKLFAGICEEAGIKRQMTAPYSPQQDGVVERRNRSVMEMARSMLKSMKIPGKFWGEAVRHAVYLLNILPTRPMGEQTPFEAMNGRKPHLGHVKVFGCLAHAKQTTPQLKKLDDRSQRLVYFGVEEGSKAHRLYDPMQKRIVISRDTIFEEAVSWGWNEFSTNEMEEDQVGGEMFVDNTDWETVNVDDNVEMPQPGTDETLSAGSSGSVLDELQSPGAQSSASINTDNSLQETENTHSVGEQSNPEMIFDDLSDEEPQHFRNLNDIYDDTEEVELADSDEVEALLTESDEPENFSEAVGNPEWVEAMNNEIISIEKNGTWKLSKLPTGHKAIGLKWVFKLKRNADGEIVKHKARLVAKGYVQKHGVDYDEVFAPVARIDTVKLILALAANRGWKVHHLDVKTAFLNGDLEEEVYVVQPEGYAVKGKEQCVLKLSKSLYGLKQAPRAWNIKLDKSLKKLGFAKCPSESAVYKREDGEATIILGVYVDDLLITGNVPSEIDKFKQQMSAEFEMSDLGLLSYYLGIEVEQHDDFITLKQAGYAKKILARFGMEGCNTTKVPMNPGTKLDEDKKGKRVDTTEYRSVIGCLRYLLHTRPDLAFSVGIVSRHMEKPTVMHQNAVKQILRYVQGSADHGLVYTKGGGPEVLVAYSDSDHAADTVGRRSTAGMAFYLNGCLITWGSQKQKTVALSSCEAEFMAATVAAMQALWLRSLLSELTSTPRRTVTMFVDNNSAIALMKNPVFHGRSKHIDTRYHFIRECIERGQIVVKRVSTDEQKADLLTKPLAAGKLEVMKHLIGVRDVSVQLA